MAPRPTVGRPDRKKLIMAYVSVSQSPIAHAHLAERRDGLVVLSIHHTDYQLHLVADNAAVAALPLHKPVTGRITASARRVDLATTGGRFIEPVYGRPRRVQGRISAIDVAANTITVQTACPFTVTLMPIQKAGDFAVGQLVGFDVEKGAAFEPADG